jgi:hypothetical protein
MNDTIIFLVLAGLALIFKWLTKQGSSDTETPPPPSLPNEPIQRTPPLTEEERVRRFLEALGVPPGTQAPPPVRPRTITPRPVATSAPPAPPPKVRRRWAQPLPPLVTTPKDVPPPPPAPAWQPDPIFVMEAPSEPAALPAISAALAAPLTSKVAPARVLPMAALRPLLRSREKIRQAIMLREILGPPLGLEPFGQFQGQ